MEKNTKDNSRSSQPEGVAANTSGAVESWFKQFDGNIGLNDLYSESELKEMKKRMLSEVIKKINAND